MEARVADPEKPSVLNKNRPRGLIGLSIISIVVMLAAVGFDAVRTRGTGMSVRSPVTVSNAIPPTPVPIRPAPVRSTPKGIVASSSSTPRPASTRIRRGQLVSKAEFDRLETTGLQDAWSKEDNDPEWSANVRAFMEVFLQTAEVDPSALRAADCRASLCRLEVDFSAPDSLRRVGRTMTDSGKSLRSTWLSHPDGGPRVAVVYMPREDLPAE